MYIKPERVLASFRRLQMRPEFVERGAKSGRERTSAISYFLAYDMVRRGQGSLSLNPESEEGRNNRQQLGVSYSKIALLCSPSHQDALVSYDFGQVEHCPPSRPPHRKLTDNFLTTRLITASKEDKPMDYPQRPPNPLLLLGPSGDASRDRWTLKAHPAWWDNLPSLLADRRSTTIFLDLAVFLLRDTDLKARDDGSAVIETGLKSIFSEVLATMISTKIKAETRLPDGKWVSRDTTWLQNGHTPAFDEGDYAPTLDEVQRLRAYIKELQAVLDDFGYEYPPTPE